MSLQLTILELCRGDSTANDAIATTLEIAEIADELGFRRFWLAEHHTEGVGHSSPEVMMAVIAGLTTQIRVGAAGILLRFRSALKVAEDFRALEALYPGRIDLGLARGTVAPAVESVFSRDVRVERSYEAKVLDLLNLLGGREEIDPNPNTVSVPEVWMLGSNSRSLALAAELGLPFCLSLFLRGATDTPEKAVADYRKAVRQAHPHREARVSVAIAGICAETELGAADLRARAGDSLVSNVVGTPRLWKERVSEISEQFECDEIVLADLSRNRVDRLAFVRLIGGELIPG